MIIHYTYKLEHEVRKWRDRKIHKHTQLQPHIQMNPKWLNKMRLNHDIKQIGTKKYDSNIWDFVDIIFGY